MRVKSVLIGFGVINLLFALSFLPVEKILPASLEDPWEIFTGVLWGLMTIISISLLQVTAPLVAPFLGAGISRVLVGEGLLAAILIAVAVCFAVCLRSKDLTPGRRGTYTFFLLLALTLVAMVRFTMYSWSHFA
jgi:hypothetical protein